MDKLSCWQEKLRNKGLRCTEHRTAILKVMLDAKKPMTAREIYSLLRKKENKLRLSTVYRNLNNFVENKLARKMEINPEQKESYFELIESHHHHLICIKCGEIVPLKCPLEGYEEKLSEETNYTILEHKIKFFGFCPECKKE